MKRAAVLSFSDRGRALAERITSILKDEYAVRTVEPRGNLKGCMHSLFAENDALIFVGACGIAVRAIAPHIVSKTADPAVIVTDERAMHVISLLSGHIGGANELTEKLAKALGSDPVITTATDVNRRFSVDAWASTHGCAISSMAIAKEFSAEILKRDLPVMSEFELPEKLPDGLARSGNGDLGVYIGIRGERPFDCTLSLIPRIVCLGIGCKRGTPKEKIQAAVDELLERENIRPEAICVISSIDVKADEAGLLAYAESLKIRPEFYSAEELNAVPGDFSPSAFVRKTVGTDNVCERSAKCAAGEDARIIVHKTCAEGVTAAIALKKWSVSFE